MAEKSDKRRWLLGGGSVMLLAVGGILGIIFWGGFNTFMEYTNSYEFCTSCHEMDIVNSEYKKSTHAANPSGVPAVCSDCHVPKPWGQKLWRKIKASKELYHKVLGTIDTAEKFEAKRLQLAQNVWHSMKTSDSRECRNCHTPETMILKGQSDMAQKWHQRGLIEGGQTCIDCHKGIAHQLPDLTKTYTMTFAKIQKAPAGVAGDTVAAIAPIKVRKKAETDSMALADVDAGTNMELLEIKDGLARLKLTYWDREQAPNLLEDFMRPIRAGKLTFDGMDEVKVLEKKTDPQTQLEWRKVVIEGWSEIANIRKAGNAVWDYAKQMHEGDCQLCHYLDPIEKYQVVEWPVRIKRMKRYTKLSLQQQLLLARYLQRERYDLGPINGER